MKKTSRGDAMIVINLKRLLLPEHRIDTIAQIGAFPDEYAQLWRWIGGDNGVQHPHPRCCYWIEDSAAPAQQTGEDHLVRGEN